MKDNSEFLRLVARAFVKNEALAFIKEGVVSTEEDLKPVDGNMQPFGETTFVFPNRRSMKFFQKYLGEEYGKVYNKPFFSPEMLTISELFNELSGLQPVDPIKAQYILYRNYICLKYCANPNQIQSDLFDTAPVLSLEQAMEQEPFDEFLHWGSAIIADFNDIDKYLIDARQFFTNIKDLKQLDSDYSFLSETQLKAVEKFWSSFLKGGDNFKKESFSSLWSIMYALYDVFRKELEQQGLGYEGMIYRKVAENPGVCSYNKLVFIGFNAPNKCERALMRWLKEHNKGDFYWDFYGPMVTDRDNKASMFVSDAVKEFLSKYDIGQQELPVAEFHAVGVPSGVGQAFVAADILNGLSGCDPIKTAVVLPDENMLMPLLNSIPESYSKINVTMGFPISATPLMSFMNAVASLQKETKERGGVACFYHSSISDVLKHEYIKGAALEESEHIIKEIVKRNLVYIEQQNELLQCVGSPLLQAIFRIPQDSSGLLDYLIVILKELDSVTDTLNKEFIYRYYLGIERLKELDVPIKKETCLRLLKQITASITIPFRGEPLAGLQVIGSLETRALDFENVIILSVNEGRFPATALQNSLIPYNLRIGFGLPTYELHDAIAAYHFYRSVYRAKNVWLIYDTRTEGLQNGEASRYVKQLKYHYNVNVNELVVSSAPIVEKQKSAITVGKSAEVMEKLRNAFANEGGRGLSATSLNTYISCPLRFYLEYVENIKEEDEVEESIESSTFGTIFHNTVEKIYSAYIGQVVTPEILDKEIKDVKNIEALIEQQFRDININEIVGRNIIIKEVLKKYIIITLQEDKKFAPFTYIAGEQPFKYVMQLSNGLDVRFGAKIDRIDQTAGGTVRIIDYKTGNVGKFSSDVEIERLFDKSVADRPKEMFQLQLYAFIVASSAGLKLKNGNTIHFKVEENESSLDVAIYPVVKMKTDSIMLEPVYKGRLSEFEEQLRICVEEIFNDKIPFMGLAEPDERCKYCMFKSICGR